MRDVSVTIAVDLMLPKGEEEGEVKRKYFSRCEARKQLPAIASNAQRISKINITLWGTCRT